VSLLYIAGQHAAALDRRQIAHGSLEAACHVRTGPERVRGRL
jgi:hypothetical protein